MSIYFLWHRDSGVAFAVKQFQDASSVALENHCILECHQKRQVHSFRAELQKFHSLGPGMLQGHWLAQMA